jgi:hypothetical protein
MITLCIYVVTKLHNLPEILTTVPTLNPCTYTSYCLLYNLVRYFIGIEPSFFLLKSHINPLNITLFKFKLSVTKLEAVTVAAIVCVVQVEILLVPFSVEKTEYGYVLMTPPTNVHLFLKKLNVEHISLKIGVVRFRTILYISVCRLINDEPVKVLTSRLSEVVAHKHIVFVYEVQLSPEVLTLRTDRERLVGHVNLLSTH